MEVHGFTGDGSIDVTLGDVRMTVPDDMSNRHRQMIAEWEAEGNTIPPYVPPSASELPNLEPDQFWFVVRASGHEQDLRDWVASLNEPGSPNHDPMAWAAASAKLDFAKFFERDHPLVEAARGALGMTAEELDALWTYAAFGLEPTV